MATSQTASKPGIPAKLYRIFHRGSIFAASPPLAPEVEPEPEASAPTVLDTAGSTEPPPATQ